MTQLIPYLIAAAGAVTLLLLFLDGKSASVRTADGARTWWLLLLIALAGVAGEIAIDIEGVNERMWQGLALGALGAAVLRAIVVGLRDRVTTARQAGVWLPVILVGWLFATNVAQNFAAVGTSSLLRVVAVGFWVLFAVYLKVAAVDLRSIAKAAAALMAVIGLAIGLIGDPWRACDQFKCGLYGALLRGPFASENLLGMLAALTLLLMIASRRSGPWRWTTLVTAVVVMSGTTSRTSTIAVLSAVGFWVAASPKVWRGTRAVNAAYAVAVLGAQAASAYLILTAELSTLSNRGRIWTYAREAIDGFTLTGLGVDRWPVLQAAGALPPLYPHNQLLMVFFGGGAVAVALYVALLLSPLRAATEPTTRRFVMAYGVYLSVLGIAEVVWNPLAIDVQLAVLVPFFAYALSRPVPAATERALDAASARPTSLRRAAHVRREVLALAGSAR